jgi:hypothetical protein
MCLLVAGKVPDLPAVTGLMQDRGQLEDVGGGVGLYDLSTASFEGQVYFDQHVRTVMDKSATSWRYRDDASCCVGAQD